MKLPVELVLLVIDELPLQSQFQLFFGYSPIEVKKVIDQYDVRLSYLSLPEQLWIFSVFADSKNLQMYQWLKRRQIPGISHRVGDGACRNGHLDIVQDLHLNQLQSCFTTDAMDLAAAYGFLDIVRFLHENRDEGCNVKAMDWAALHGHLDIVKFLHEHRKEGCTFEAMNGAAEEGRLDVVVYLHEKRLEGCTSNAIDQAAAAGHFEIIKFLAENRTEGCTQRALNNAVMHNHLKIVKYLVEKMNRDFDIDYALRLAENKEIIEYLQTHH